MRRAAGQTIHGANFAFDLGPGRLVSNVGNEARWAVPSRSDVFAPRWKIIRRDFQRVEEVCSAAVIPL